MLTLQERAVFCVCVFGIIRATGADDPDERPQAIEGRSAA
jgi:hypothetical protein